MVVQSIVICRSHDNAYMAKAAVLENDLELPQIAIIYRDPPIMPT